MSESSPPSPNGSSIEGEMREVTLFGEVLFWWRAVDETAGCYVDAIKLKENEAMNEPENTSKNFSNHYIESTMNGTDSPNSSNKVDMFRFDSLHTILSEEISRQYIESREHIEQSFIEELMCRRGCEMEGLRRKCVDSGVRERGGRQSAVVAAVADAASAAISAGVIIAVVTPSIAVPLNVLLTAEAAFRQTTTFISLTSLRHLYLTVHIHNEEVAAAEVLYTIWHHEMNEMRSRQNICVEELRSYGNIAVRYEKRAPLIHRVLLKRNENVGRNDIRRCHTVGLEQLRVFLGEVEGRHRIEQGQRKKVVGVLCLEETVVREGLMQDYMGVQLDAVCTLQVRAEEGARGGIVREEAKRRCGVATQRIRTAQRVATTTPRATLPVVLLEHILSWLNVADKRTARRCCQGFLRVVREDMGSATRVLQGFLRERWLVRLVQRYGVKVRRIQRWWGAIVAGMDALCEVEGMGRSANGFRTALCGARRVARRQYLTGVSLAGARCTLFPGLDNRLVPRTVCVLFPPAPTCYVCELSEDPDDPLRKCRCHRTIHTQCGHTEECCTSRCGYR